MHNFIERKLRHKSHRDMGRRLQNDRPVRCSSLTYMRLSQQALTLLLSNEPEADANSIENISLFNYK